MVVGQDDILGSSELSRERDELRETCEVLEWKNYDAKKEMEGLWANTDATTSLQKEMDRYGTIHVGCQVDKLKVSLAGGDKWSKKLSEDTVEACRAFELGRKVL